MMIAEQDYFDTKAARAWRGVGGAAGTDLTAVAGWARAAHAADQRNVGVLIDDAAQVVAQTVCIQAGPRELRAWYVDQCAGVPEVDNQVLDLAMARIQTVTGRPVVHLRFGELCQGAGR